MASTSQQQTGAEGEAAAQGFLAENGFVVLHTNWRYKHAEVDIIASKQGVLHFVEVKTLRSKRFGPPEAKVNAAKLNKLKEAASGFLYQHPQWQLIQFDIVSVFQPAQDAAEFFVVEDVF